MRGSVHAAKSEPLIGLPCGVPAPTPKVTHPAVVGRPMCATLSRQLARSTSTMPVGSRMALTIFIKDRCDTLGNVEAKSKKMTAGAEGARPSRLRSLLVAASAVLVAASRSAGGGASVAWRPPSGFVCASGSCKV